MSDTKNERLHALLSANLKKTSYLILAQFAARIINLLYFLLLARWLGVAALGDLTYAVAIFLIIDILSDAGMSRVMLREASRAPKTTERWLGLMLPLKMLLVVILTIAALAIVAMLDLGGGSLWLFAVVGAGVFFSAPSLLFEQVLHARAMFGYVAVAHVALALTQLAGGAAANAAGGGLISIAAMLTFGQAVYLAVVLAGLRKAGVAFSPWFDFLAWRESAVAAAPYAVVVALLLVGPKIEFLILGRSADGEVLGHYGAALRIFEAALMAPFVFCTVMGPRFIECRTCSPAELPSLYGYSVRIILSGTVPLALVGVYLSDVVVGLLLPEEFDYAGTLLAIMFLAYPTIALHFLNISVMLGMQRQRRPALLLTALAAGQTVLAYYFIGSGGAEGGAIAFALSIGGACVASSVAISAWYLDQFSLLRGAAPPVLAGTAAAAAVFVIGLPASFMAAAAAVLTFAAIAGPLSLWVRL